MQHVADLVEWVHGTRNLRFFYLHNILPQDLKLYHSLLCPRNFTISRTMASKSAISSENFVNPKAITPSCSPLKFNFPNTASTDFATLSRLDLSKWRVLINCVFILCITLFCLVEWVDLLRTHSFHNTLTRCLTWDTTKKIQTPSPQIGAATKNIVNTPWECFVSRSTNVMYSKFRDWSCQTNLASCDHWITLLAVQLLIINQIIQDSGPNALRNYHHCTSLNLGSIKAQIITIYTKRSWWQHAINSERFTTVFGISRLS